MSSKADIEKPISLVRPANARTVQAILDRAYKQEKSADKALARSMNQAIRPTRSKGVLSKALGAAMAHHGRTKRGAVSLRPKAPDTNGRSFHFSHTTVGKTPGASSAGKGADGPTGPTANAGDDNGTSGGPSTGSSAFPDLGSREAGHQRYVERGAALARDAVEAFGVRLGRDAEAERGREAEDGWERDPAAERSERAERMAKPIELDRAALQKEIEQASRGQRTQSAGAAQEYIEDVEKVAHQTRHGHSNSFGTIGETFEERVAFWNDVTKHEREKDARTQIRLVLELPHEASPATRQEIVRKFCQQYEELGVPYWASIHAPTKKNDHRNHHAHIVHGIRPTTRMIDPSTGRMAWDFTIIEEYRDKTRHKKQRHPHRRNVVAAFRNRDYVRDTRQKFVEVTNEVLTAHGYDIRYDARSYKDMGLDIEPMKHVSRVIADKAKVRDFVVLDAAWTRRLIDQEMNAAAVERDKTYVELKTVEKKLVSVAGDIRNLTGANLKLPANMKLSLLSQLTVTTAKRLTQRMLEIEQAKIAQRFADEASARTIQHIIESTAPVSAHRGGRARHVRPTPDGPAAPNPEVMALLHASAKEEMRLHRIATADRARKLGYAAIGVLQQWQQQAQPTARTTPIMPDGAKPGRSRDRTAFPTSHATGTPTPAAPKPEMSKPTFAPDYRADETLARSSAARAATPAHHMQPTNFMELLERTSPTGQRFPKMMHDYVNRQATGIANAVSTAQAAGPGGVTALWDSIKAKIARPAAQAAEPAMLAHPTSNAPLMADPPPVIHVGGTAAAQDIVTRERLQRAPERPRTQVPEGTPQRTKPSEAPAASREPSGTARVEPMPATSAPQYAVERGEPHRAPERPQAQAPEGMPQRTKPSETTAASREPTGTAWTEPMPAASATQYTVARGESQRAPERQQTQVPERTSQRTKPSEAPGASLEPAGTARAEPRLGSAAAPAVRGSTKGDGSGGTLESGQGASNRIGNHSGRANEANAPQRDTPRETPAAPRASNAERASDAPVAPAAAAAARPEPRVVRSTQPAPPAADAPANAASRQVVSQHANRGVDTVAPPPRQGRIVRPSDFKRQRQVLRKEGNRPITQEELWFIPPKRGDPDAPRHAALAREPTEVAMPVITTETTMAEAKEADAKKKRRKQRWKVLGKGRSCPDRSRAPWLCYRMLAQSADGFWPTCRPST